MTLYAYAKDSVGTTTCYSACAANWPPYTTASAAGLSASPDATGAVSVIQRADGTLQITYNDVPLYFYIKDSVVGDTKGQNVGKVWKVVNP